jgi:hypothetical protein
MGHVLFITVPATRGSTRMQADVFVHPVVWLQLFRVHISRVHEFPIIPGLARPLVGDESEQIAGCYPGVGSACVVQTTSTTDVKCVWVVTTGRE